MKKYQRKRNQIIINAFSDFVERQGYLSHSVIISDMKSDTEKYVELQNM